MSDLVFGSQFILGPKAAKRPINLFWAKGHKAAHQFILRPKAAKY